MKIKNVCLLVIFIFGGLLFSVGARAATLYFSPNEGSFGPGDSFALDIKIDTDRCINTIEAYINFPKGYLSLTDFVVGNSVLSLWLERPSTADMAEINKQGVLHFAGGVPGGYCGKIPGDPGDSNIVGRLVFHVPGLVVGDNKATDLSINFIEDKTKVLINDGYGTEDEVNFKKAVFNYTSRKTQNIDLWKKEKSADNIPPIPFTIYLRKDKGVYNNQYYVTFNTVDKQSGIDHYEILEIKPGEEIGKIPESGFMDRLLGREKKAPQWQKAQIPYLLKDQSLRSIIKVKAIDKAGNERVVEYIPQEDLVAAQKERRQKIMTYSLLVVIVVGTLLIVIFFIWYIFKKIKVKKHYEED